MKTKKILVGFNPFDRRNIYGRRQYIDWYRKEDGWIGWKVWGIRQLPEINDYYQVYDDGWYHNWIRITSKEKKWFHVSKHSSLACIIFLLYVMTLSYLPRILGYGSVPRKSPYLCTVHNLDEQGTLPVYCNILLLQYRRGDIVPISWHCHTWILNSELVDENLSRDPANRPGIEKGTVAQSK